MLKVIWWNSLCWEVNISWSKNAALPLIAASVLINWKTIFKNVPRIWDIFTFLEILESAWVFTKFVWNTLEIDTKDINPKNLDFEKIKKIRASVLLLAPMLQRFWRIAIPFPWGCNIWKRPINWHLEWLKKIGYEVSLWVKSQIPTIDISWELESWDKVINAWFWVTTTENLIMANIFRNWKTIIKLSAIEPHVMNLIDFLRKVWANIKMRFDHEIIIEWVEELKENIEFEVIWDYIESWTFMIIWALSSKDYLDIKNARIDDLYSFIEKLKEVWVKVENLGNDTLRVYRVNKIKATKIQTNIFPGFPTDLQSPFAVLLSQAEWESKIHEVLFEWRLSWLVELEKMKAKINILNPHEAEIVWPILLKWTTVTSWDLRAWVSMIIAWLVASWETLITNVEYIKRWYENIVEKLKNIWADIEEIEI
jgi:UDP-N-acetylglucosamine 1-carboxyvinyltransferase